MLKGTEAAEVCRAVDLMKISPIRVEDEAEVMKNNLQDGIDAVRHARMRGGHLPALVVS